MFGNGSQEDLLQHLPWTEAKVTRQYFPRSSFSPLLNTAVIFPFSQTPGTSPSQHPLPKVIESGLVMTSASSLSPQRYTSSGCMNLLCSIALGVWDFWRQVLPVKTKAKAALSTSAFSIFFIIWKRKFIVFKHHRDLQTWSVNTCQGTSASVYLISQISLCEKLGPYFMPRQLQNSFML